MMTLLKKFGITFWVLLMHSFSSVLLAQQSDIKQEVSKEQIQNLLNQCEALKQNTEWKENNSLYLLSRKGLNMVSPEDDANRSRFYNYLGYGYYLLMDDSKIDSMQYAYQQSLQEAQKAKSAQLIALACMSLMHLSYELQKTEMVEKYKNILQPIIDTISDKNTLREGYAALGNYYQNKSYYSTAQDYYLKSVNLTKQQSDTAHTSKPKQNLASRYYMLAQLYLKTDMADEAINALYAGMRFYNFNEEITYLFYPAFIEAFCKKGNIDSALNYLHNYIDPLETFYKKKGVVHTDVIFSNLAVAQYYIDKKKYDSASPFVNKTISLINFNKNNYPNSTYPVEKMGGQYFLETKNYKRAIDTLLRALPIAKEMNREDEADILKYLALAQQGLGNNGIALQYYEQYTLLLDSLTKEKVSRNFADLETRYQTNEKQNQIVSLDQKNKLNILELKQASNTRTLMILGLISLGIFSLLLYFIYRNKEKLNKILNGRNTELDVLNNQLAVANDTKAKLFGIIGHDLRSPVSRIVQMLKIQKERPELLDENSKKHYEENLKLASENVLETMEDLLLWSKSQMQHFKPEMRNVLISEVVEKNVSFLKEQAEIKSIRIQNEIPESLTLKTDENFLEIIIRNLLQNAVKYSSDGTTISITSGDSSRISITNKIADVNVENLNTVFQNKSVNSKSNGLGLQIAKDLASAIGANILFDLKENDHLETSIVWGNA